MGCVRDSKWGKNPASWDDAAASLLRRRSGFSTAGLPGGSPTGAHASRLRSAVLLFACCLCACLCCPLLLCSARCAGLWRDRPLGPQVGAAATGRGLTLTVRLWVRLREDRGF
jgi:hypothetical protein